MTTKMYHLTGPDGKQYESPTKGTLGGYKRGTKKIYGRLDCPSALGWIAKGHYTDYRVFFADEEAAIAAGFRPCAKCTPEQYAAWKKANKRIGADNNDGGTESRL